jgi:hypothetical protein
MFHIFLLNDHWLLHFELPGGYSIMNFDNAFLLAFDRRFAVDKSLERERLDSAEGLL